MTTTTPSQQPSCVPLPRLSDEAAANAADPVINLIEWEVRRKTLIAQREQRDGKVVYRFDIRLQGEDETVFFDI